MRGSTHFKKATGGGNLLLDTYPGATVCYSLQKKKSDYTGALIKIRRSSNNDLLDIYPKANGLLNTDAILDFIGTGGAYIHTWHDQANGFHALQTINSDQPQIADSGVIYLENGYPYIDFNFTSPRFLIYQGMAFTTGYASIFAVMNLDANTSVPIFDCSSNQSFGSSNGIRFDKYLGETRFGTNGSFAKTAFNSYGFGLTTAIKSDTNRTLWENGTERITQANSGTISFAGITQHKIGTLTSGSNQNSGTSSSLKMSELTIYNSNETADRVNIEAIIKNNYGL